MSSIVVAGDTSGSVTLQAPAVAGSTVLTLPAVSGTVITTGTTGQVIPKAALPTGSVLQVVSATNNTLDTTSSTSWVATSLFLSITPTSSTSKILLLSTATVGIGTANVGNFAFAKNGTILNAGGTSWGASFLITSAFGNGNGYPWSENWLDLPATTAAITYAVYFRVDSGGPVAFNGRIAGNPGAATLIAMEISA